VQQICPAIPNSFGALSFASARPQRIGKLESHRMEQGLEVHSLLPTTCNAWLSGGATNFMGVANCIFFHAVSSNCKKEEEEKYTTHLSQLGGMHAPP